MKFLTKLLVAVAFALSILGSPLAQAQGVDVVARGLASQVLAVAVPANSRPAVYNLTPATTIGARKGLARQRAGLGRMTFNLVGDSTTAGIGAGSDLNALGARAKSYPTRLAETLTARGLPARADSVWGSSNISPYNTYDTRLTFGAGWDASGPVSIGNLSFKGVAGSAGTLDIAFPTSIDTIVVYWLRSGSQGIPDVRVDGGATLTTSATSGVNPGVNIATYVVAKAVHTVNIKAAVTGAGTYIVGVEVYDSTTPTVSIRNMGWSGATSTSWNNATDYKAPLTALAVVPADVTILSLGINNWSFSGAAGLATYVADIQAIITSVKASGGDVWLLAPTPSDPAYSVNTSVAIQNSYIAALRGLAYSNGLPLISWYERTGGFATANAMGFMADQRHPSALGYPDEAQFIASVIGGL